MPVADAVAVNRNGIKTLSANSLSTFLIKGNPVFNDGSQSLLKNPPDFTVLCNWVFKHFILALQSFKVCVLVNNNLFGKLFSLLVSLTIFDERFKFMTL